MPVTLKLFSTSHCHLCDQAEALVAGLATQYKFEWLIEEITDDAALFARYATTIPVLNNVHSNREISWPFSSKDIEILLTS